LFKFVTKCWLLLKFARVDTQRHDRVGVTTASYREVPGSILDTQIDCLAEVLHMVAGSDFEMLEVQLTANVIVEH